MELTITIVAIVFLLLSVVSVVAENNKCSACGRERCKAEGFSRRLSGVILAAFTTLVLVGVAPWFSSSA